MAFQAKMGNFKYEENLKEMFEGVNKYAPKNAEWKWKNNFIIMGSAALWMQGIINRSNRDVDILLYRSTFSTLIANNKIMLSDKLSCLSEFSIYQDISKKIDIFSDESLSKIAPYSYWKAHMLHMDGYNVIDPEANYTFYQGLYIRSKGKEKFIDRLVKISDAISDFIVWSKKSRKLDWLAYFESKTGDMKNAG